MPKFVIDLPEHYPLTVQDMEDVMWNGAGIENVKIITLYQFRKELADKIRSNFNGFITDKTIDFCARIVEDKL